MKKERKHRRKEGSFALTSRQTCKTSTKEKRKFLFFFFHYINRTQILRNRKQTICAMLVSVHYIEIVQFFFCH